MVKTGGKVAYVFQPVDNGYKAGECHGIMVTRADYINKEAIGGFKDTDYANNMYWTSTDKSRNEAYTYNFEHSMGMTTSKDVKFWFRPARYF